MLCEGNHPANYKEMIKKKNPILRSKIKTGNRKTRPERTTQSNFTYVQIVNTNPSELAGNTTQNTEFANLNNSLRKIQISKT